MSFVIANKHTFSFTLLIKSQIYGHFCCCQMSAYIKHYLFEGSTIHVLIVEVFPCLTDPFNLMI
jgi:hypothetical protein